MILNNFLFREQEKQWKMNKEDWMILVNGLKVKENLKKNQLRTNYFAISESFIRIVI